MNVLSHCQAFVLHRRPYQESSWLMTLFTEHHGKIHVIAKGAKRPKSVWRGLLEPFQLLDVDCRGRSTLKTLTRADLVQYQDGLKGQRLLAGLYLNELLYKALPEPWVPIHCFQAYQTALMRLRAGQIQRALRAFEYQLLTALGYGMSLTHDHHGAPIEKNRYYRWQESEGFCPLFPSEVGVNAASGEALLALSQDTSNETLLASLKPMLQGALKVHIQSDIHTRMLWVQN